LRGLATGGGRLDDSRYFHQAGHFYRLTCLCVWFLGTGDEHNAQHHDHCNQKG
jgi:hypothetical protein